LVIVDIILPVFIIIFLGYLLSRYGRVSTTAFSRTQLYILSPALVFIATGRAEVSTALIFRVFIFIAIIEAFLFVVSQAIGFGTRRGRPVRHAMSLTSMFMNSGFYGIPVCMLAFGEKGFVYAVTFVVASSVLQTSVGIYLAASGCSRSVDALRSVLKVPVLYAIVVARVVAHYDLYPPESYMKVIDMLGQSAIPLGLLLLGMQLERIVSAMMAGRGGVVAEGQGVPVDEVQGEGQPQAGITGEMKREESREDLIFGSISAVLRLGGGLALALLVLSFLDFNPILKKVLIVEASMPTAVNTVVYATEFRCRPALTAIAVLVSTLLSIVSIPLILRFLG